MTHQELLPVTYKKIVLDICELGNLEKYKDVIAQLCNVIEHNGCEIACHTKNMSSAMQFEEQPLIKLAVNNQQKPIRIIWDLVHEYGHFLCGAPKEGEAELQREEQAWRHARKMVLKSPKLMPFLMDFKQYKEQCLDPYRH